MIGADGTYIALTASECDRGLALSPLSGADTIAALRGDGRTRGTIFASLDEYRREQLFPRRCPRCGRNHRSTPENLYRILTKLGPEALQARGILRNLQMIGRKAK